MLWCRSDVLVVGRREKEAINFSETTMTLGKWELCQGSSCSQPRPHKYIHKVKSASNTQVHFNRAHKNFLLPYYSMSDVSPFATSSQRNLTIRQMQVPPYEMDGQNSFVEVSIRNNAMLCAKVAPIQFPDPHVILYWEFQFHMTQQAKA